MKNLMIRMVIMLVAGLVSLPALAQKRFVISGEQELAVIGSSTLHNWEMVAYEAEGSGLFWLEDQRINQVTHLNVRFEAASLESGRGRIMDRNARRALKVEENPFISFELQKFEDAEEGKFRVIGELTAAGKTRPMTFLITYILNGDAIEVRGRSSFKLTDFEIEPPVALAGTLRTADAVSLEIVLNFKEAVVAER